MNDPQTLVDAYFDAIRRKDADAWAACFAADATAHDPANAPPRVGREAQRAFLAGVAALFHELDFRPRRVFPCGPSVAVYFSAHCVANNGKAVEVEGIDCFELDEEGRIRQVLGYWDPSPLFAAAA
jgi:steroid Delta-isomerase